MTSLKNPQQKQGRAVVPIKTFYLLEEHFIEA